MVSTSIQMPKQVEIESGSKGETFAKFILQPLEKGYGVTVGNTFRRVLLSSLPGQAFTSVRIDGVLHEFSTVKGVTEDVSQIILNLKQVRMKLNEKKPTQIDISFKGKRELTAGDLVEAYPDIEVLNPDLHIASLNATNTNISMSLTVGRGCGYVTSEENKFSEAPVGTIFIDSIFTPIRNVRYFIDATRVGQQTDFEKLILEVETDGSITPEDAVVTAGKIIRDHVQLFLSLGKEPEAEHVSAEELSELTRIKKILTTPIDEIELSVRSRNCLQAAQIKTIGELVRRDESELLNVRNFGRKSLGELSGIVQDLGLHFGMDVDKYLNEGSH